MHTSPIRRLGAATIVAAAAALTATAARAAEPQREPFALVSMDEVERMLGKPDVVVVDANPEDVYRSPPRRPVVALEAARPAPARRQGAARGLLLREPALNREPRRRP